MKKIDLSNVQEIGGSYKKLPAGAYVLQIIKVEDISDKNRLDFYFDIAEGEYKGYYSERYKADDRPNKRWGGRFSKSYDTNNERALPFFKQFVTAVQNSNKGFVFDGEHEQTFVKKLVGATFREEEFLNSKGGVSVSCKPDMFHSVDKVRSGDVEIREIKKLNITKTTNDFVNPFANDTAPTDAVAESFADNNPFGDSNPFN